MRFVLLEWHKRPRSRWHPLVGEEGGFGPLIVLWRYQPAIGWVGLHLYIAVRVRRWFRVMV